ncbi:MAG: YncE family protein [Burkholderiales bacterium]|nr:YncE family protein [Burkholderiales bacterium]
MSIKKQFLAAVVSGLAAGGALANVLVVLNSGEASVSLIDPQTRKELRRFEVGKEPHHLMRTPDGQSLIVANAVSNDLHFLDPKTGEIQRRMRDIPDPYQLGYSPDRKWFVTAALRLDRIDVYAVQGEGPTKNFKPVKQIKVPDAPSHLIFSADSSMVFATLQDSHEIVAIRMADQSIAWKMKVGDLPAGIWMTPDDRHLLVGVMGKDYVEVIDWRAQKGVKRIATGKGAHNFRPLGDGRHVFVTNRIENTVSVIDMQVLEKKYDIKVPSGPDCMEVSADGKTLWVTQRFAKSVAVVDIGARQTVATIPVGKSPHGIFIAQSAPWK